MRTPILISHENGYVQLRTQEKESEVRARIDILVDETGTIQLLSDRESTYADTHDLRFGGEKHDEREGQIGKVNHETRIT